MPIITQIFMESNIATALTLIDLNEEMYFDMMKEDVMDSDASSFDFECTDLYDAEVPYFSDRGCFCISQVLSRPMHARFFFG